MPPRRVPIRRLKLLVGLATGALVGAASAAAIALRVEAVERAELWSYDLRARRALELGAAPSPRIVLLDVDESSIDSAKRYADVSWPWPRELHGVAVKYLADAGVRGVAYDFVFEDPGAYGAEDNEAFAAAIRASRGAVVLAMSATDNAPAAAPPPGPWAALVGRAPDDRGARALAARLQAWAVRAFVLAGAGGREVWIGGRTARKELLRDLERLRAQPDLGELVRAALALPEELDDPFAGVELRRLSPAELGGELLLAAEVAARDGLPAPQRATVPARRALILPLPTLADAARLGNVTMVPDPDGKVRRQELLVRVGERLYPSLALALARVAEPAARLTLDGRTLRFGARRVPLDDRGSAVLRYHGAAGKGYRRLSYWDVLRSAKQLADGQRPAIDPASLRGALVIVTPRARGLLDFKPTPVSQEHAGAEVMATALDDLLGGGFVRRVERPVAAAAALLLALLAGVGGVYLWVLFRNALLGALASALLTATLLGGYALATLLAYAHAGWWIDLAAPLGGGALAYTLAVVVNSYIESRDRRFVQDALGRYTSPDVVTQLLQNPALLALSGERREMTIYFSDIAGFTTISEGLPAERLVTVLNEYLGELTDVVLSFKGTVDKYIGDAIMAFWGAPLPAADHAARACLCALAMRRRLAELQPAFRARYGLDVAARAGLNSGSAVVGNMGSLHKLNYTVIGDVVNLASRLEGANKAYETDLMIGEPTYLAARDEIEVRELDLLAVKGKAQPVRVYELLAERGRLPPGLAPMLPVYAEALAQYHARRFEQALAGFQAALALRPGDGPAQVYAGRCQGYLVEPPPEGWDGVYRMKTK